MTVIEHSPAATEVTAARAIAAGRFSLRIHPEREEWCDVEEWMLKEGWDPGYSDTAAAQSLDPRALVIGMLDGRPVAAVSLLRVSDEYAFAGNLIVDPAFRGRGFARALWSIAAPHAGDRVIGVEAPDGQLAAFLAAGFLEAYRTISYRGRAAARPRPVDARVRGIEPRDCDAVAGLDALCSPLARKGLLARWLSAGASRTLVHEQDGQVTGFGVIRPCRSGYRIGPLTACTEGAAPALYDALTGLCPGELISLSAPEPNRMAGELASARGLAQHASTVRMYSQPVRPVALSRCYAIASLAYG